MSRLEDLYKAKIRELAKNPFQFRELKDFTHVFTAYNPLCGDKFTFYLIVEKRMISEASFYGFGCAISKASSSILTSKLLNKSIDELPMLVNGFLLAINNQESKTDVDYESFKDVHKFPERLSCVTLGWNELDEQLKAGNLI